MPSYIVYAILAYMILAVHGILDKFMLTKTVKHPVAYTFYSGTTTILVFLIAPFGLHWIGLNNFFIALISGASFLFAMYFLYVAIQESSVSRILPIQGGLVPLFTYILATVLIGDRLTLYQTLAFALLTFGAVLIAFKHEKGSWRATALKDAVLAAFLFALSFVLAKHIYDISNLVSGLVWTRVGLFLASLSLLIPRHNRKLIFSTPKTQTKQNALLFYSTRLLGALAGLLQNYAVSIGSVVIVNALQGLQFTFLLAATSILSIYFPKILKEKINKQVLILKFTAIILITCGLFLLSK